MIVVGNVILKFLGMFCKFGFVNDICLVVVCVWFIEWICGMLSFGLKYFFFCNGNIILVSVELICCYFMISLGSGCRGLSFLSMFLLVLRCFVLCDVLCWVMFNVLCLVVWLFFELLLWGSLSFIKSIYRGGVSGRL